ncbi:MAG: hypothetical protein IPN27_07445 [Cellvibrionales bacterium]|nr:hypothetical protein [Cellvibrionales bacterium]
MRIGLRCLNPAPDAPKRWCWLSVPAELENVDVWLGDDVRGFQYYALGYHRSYEGRPLGTRLFSINGCVYWHADLFAR